MWQQDCVNNKSEGERTHEECAEVFEKSGDKHGSRRRGHGWTAVIHLTSISFGVVDKAILRF